MSTITREIGPQYRPWITLTDACRLLGMHADTFKSSKVTRRVRKMEVPGCQTKYFRDDVLRLIDKFAIEADET